MSIEVRPVSKFLAVALVLSAAGLGMPAFAVDLNLFEWAGVAPVVAEVRVLSLDGKFAEVHVERLIRGSMDGDAHFFLDLRQANRERNRTLDPDPLRMAEGERYVVLLDERPSGERSKLSMYSLIRGVRGARMVPAEGAPAFHSALDAFVSIHETGSDNLTWIRFAEMLDETNPIMLETALQQFAKFRRGEPDLATRVLPLLSHPRPDLRAYSAQVAGQLLNRWEPKALPEVDLLRTELVGNARRDPEIEVRVAATEALEGFDDDSMLEILQQIAEDDPDQSVRYAAERLLYERRQAKVSQDGQTGVQR